MKRLLQITRIAAFLAAAALLFSYVNQVFRAKDSEELSPYYYDYGKNTFDVLFAGSSMSKNAIQPVQLWEKYGIAAYNLSCGNQSLACSYYILQDALERETPSLVVLDTTYAEESGPVRSKTFIHYLTDEMPFTDRCRWQMIRDLLPEEERMEYYFPFYSYHNRWKELSASDFDTGTYQRYTLGSVTSSRTMSLSVPLFQRTDSDAQLSDVSRDYLEKIAQLCAENDVPLLLYCCPVAADNGGDVSEGDFNNRRAIMQQVASFASENGIPFLNFLEDDSMLGIDPYNNYKDGVHLNMWGAQKLTSWLGNYIREHYDIPDRSDDGDYSAVMADLVPRYETVLMDQAFATTSRADTVFTVLNQYGDTPNLLYLVCGQDYQGAEENVSDTLKDGLTSLGFSFDNTSPGLTNIYGVILGGSIVSSGQQAVADDLDYAAEVDGMRIQIRTNAMTDNSDGYNSITINGADVAPQTDGLAIAVCDTERKTILDCLTLRYDGSEVTHFEQAGN